MKEILKKVSELIGTENVDNPSSKDIKTLLEATLISKQLDVESLKSYVLALPNITEALINGMQLFVSSSTEISSKVLDLIKQCVEVMQEELKKEHPPDVRKDLYDKIFKLVENARAESKEHRSFMYTLASGFMAILFAIIIGLISGGGSGRTKS